MGTAKFGGRPNGWRSDARVFELDPPLKSSRWQEDEVEYQFVIVSAATPNMYISDCETCIFPAQRVNGEWEATSMLELEGSYKGGLSHKKALKNAGYKIVEEV